MTRARSGKTVLRGRKRTRKLTKGFRAGRHHLYRQSIVTRSAPAITPSATARQEARVPAPVDRRINAACRMRGLRYSEMIAGLQRGNVELDRKALADLAIHEPDVFTKIVELARANLPKQAVSA